jgi:hypothetical protein
MQVGYEKTSDKSIAILTDACSHFIEVMCRRCGEGTRPLRDIINGNQNVRGIEWLICEFIGRSGSYQVKEAEQFLMYQINMRNHLKEKLNARNSTSFLHMLRVLPKRIDERYNPGTVFLSELKEKENREISVDEFCCSYAQSVKDEGRDGRMSKKIARIDDPLVTEVCRQRCPLLSDKEYEKMLAGRRRAISFLGGYNTEAKSEVIKELGILNKRVVDKEERA